ncbi:MAG: DUF294 nucleotidyltransferase-like domain-containing protein [Hyphomicrobiales bacterium]|nr:DUF294 nucleotidyltransferase-like domain-containing protein [Hyphomicrobiales bacterium]
MRLLQKSTPLIGLSAVAFDTETTGLDARQAYIVQFGAVRVEALTVRAEPIFSELVKPDIPIPRRSTDIHGVRDADVAEAAPFPEAFANFQRFAGDAPLIGHAVDYDAAVIAAEFARRGLTWRAPLMLDTRVLARIAAPGLPNYSLEFLCEWLGAPPVKRHDALEDARACAEIFVRLAPKLREKGVVTLGQALAASRVLSERATPAEAGRAPSPPPAHDSADEPLARLDHHPYSRRVKEAMTAPPLFADGRLSLGEAARRMLDEWVSALLVRDGERLGIITERDILRAFGAHGPDVKARPIAEFMSSPLETVRADDFLYRALGRIDRLGIRHLPVVGPNGEIVGVVTPRNLLKRPMTAAFDLGDEIETACEVAALALAKAKMTPLARSLLAEGLDARGVAAVISEELLALTARAVAIAEARLAAEGRSAPASFAMLALGSVGRGESLLAADQDNAIVFADIADEAAADAWLAALGAHVADILDQAGVPYCAGGVMAKNALWRHSEAGWRRLIDDWIRRSRPQDLLNIDIFFDAAVACGDRALGEEVRSYAFQRARETPLFLRLMADAAAQWTPPLTVFQGLKTDERGRVDLKKGGLMPLFTAVRALAIKHGVEARSTHDRVRALAASGVIAGSEADGALAAQATFLKRLLLQQIADADAGAPLGSKVRVAELDKAARAEIVAAIRAVGPIVSIAREGML